MLMEFSDDGRGRLKNKEGLVLWVYCDKCKAHWGTCSKVCPGGNATIGYGHMLKPEEMALYLGRIITKQAAEDLFDKDVREPINAVNAGLKKKPIPQNRFDALVLFVFNIGAAAFLASTLLRDINAGLPMDTLEKEWMRWVHDRHGVVQGLVNRRQDEFALFKGKTSR